ncbi:MAG: hypothetical protein ACLQFF_12570 [Steroidobacteraceae bacterium]|jgi:hypothetical protein
MRYRPFTNLTDFSHDLATFVTFIGGAEYGRRLHRLGKGLNHKGYVTPVDDLRFSLELELLNLELLRRRSVGGNLPWYPERLHEAAEFVMGVGEAIPHLSTAAKNKLRGQIIGGLKTNGLRSLQHEMRIAVALSRRDCDVRFADLEGLGSFDFLAHRDAVEFEVEGKSLPIFSGYPIQPQDAEKLFIELRRKFGGWSDRTRIPILNITIDGKLPANRDDHLRLIAACNDAVAKQGDTKVEHHTAVHFVGTIPDGPEKPIRDVTHRDAFSNGIAVYFLPSHPKVIVRLRSVKKSRFARNMVLAISDAAKRQLTGSRPGIIWTHIDYIDKALFASLAYSAKRPSLFDSIANAVFNSANRRHVIQVVFSGAPHFSKDSNHGRSSFETVIYNAPDNKFGGPMFFSGGRTQIANATEKPEDGAEAKA